MSVQMQKQTARNLLLSANTQAAYGGVLADAALTYRASIDPSTAFENPDERYSDKGAAGHGTEFATVNIRTGWNSSATVKGMGGTDAWMLGWMMALIFGSEAVTGAGPYLHAFAIPNITAQMPCTTVYIQDTNDIKRKYADMAAKSLSIDIPERGPVQGTLDMVGTGKFFPGAFGTALPAVPTPNYLLGSDVTASITPVGGGLTAWAGRQNGLSVKVGRGSDAFKSSGDGLTAGSVQSEELTYSADMTIMADVNDDIVSLYENDTPMVLNVQTNPALQYGFGFNFPAAKIKAKKLGNVKNKVAWQLSFDETSMVQVGNADAMTAFIKNTCPAYLIPA